MTLIVVYSLWKSLPDIIVILFNIIFIIVIFFLTFNKNYNYYNNYSLKN
jgi:hypothetical protein